MPAAGEVDFEVLVLCEVRIFHLVPAEGQRIDRNEGVADEVLVQVAMQLDTLGVGVRQFLKRDV